MMSKFDLGRAITFNFSSKKINDVPLSDVVMSIKEDLFCWGHLPLNKSGYSVLKEVGVDADTIDRIVNNQGHGCTAVWSGCDSLYIVRSFRIRS